MKVCIIGLGSIAEKHIYALRIIDSTTEIYALRSNPDANSIDGIKNIRSLDEVENLDFVIISNPTKFHLDTVKMVASRGLAMMIEKPAFYEWTGVRALQEFINENKIFTYVACNLRFHPCLQFLKQNLTATGKVNEVNIYCGSYLPDWRPNRDYKTIYSANLALGGGVHLDLFHEVDYACWIFGLPKQWKAYTSNRSTLEIDAPDYANYLLNYRDFNINIVLNYYRKKAKRSVEVLFENDAWEVDLLKNNIKNDREEIIFSAPEFTIMDMYVQQMGYFMKKLSRSDKPMNDINETVEILKICLKNESTN